MMEESVFTKIINGDIPCFKVSEDESTFAFMDIQPIQPGMVLVVSKKQVENLEDLNEIQYQAMWSSVHKISRAIRKAYPDKAKVGIMVEGLEVPHAHIKIFPFNTEKEYRAVPDSSEPDREELAKITENIRSNIQDE